MAIVDFGVRKVIKIAKRGRAIHLPPIWLNELRVTHVRLIYDSDTGYLVIRPEIAEELGDEDGQKKIDQKA